MLGHGIGMRASVIPTGVQQGSGGGSGGGGGGDIQWFAPDGLGDGETLQLSTSTLNWGVTPPTIFYYEDCKNITTPGELSANPVIKGNGVTVQNDGAWPRVVDAPDMPWGKAIVMGAEGVNIQYANPPENCRRIRVIYPATARWMNHFYTQYPASFQVNDVLLKRDALKDWQMKQWWDFFSADGYSDPGDIDIYPGAPALYRSPYPITIPTTWTSLHWKKATRLVGNNGIGVPGDHGLSFTSNQSYMRDHPIGRQWMIYTELPPNEANCRGHYRTWIDTSVGPLQEGDWRQVTSTNWGQGTANQPETDRFTFPGFVRGFSYPDNAYMFGNQLYKADSFARVEIADGATPALSSKVSICTEQSRAAGSIVTTIRHGIFWQSGVANLYAHVYDFLGLFVGSVQLV